MALLWDIESRRLPALPLRPATRSVVARARARWTDQCKALFGLPLDAQMSYELFLESLQPNDRQRTHKAVNRALKTKTDYDIEFRVVWADGSIHWIAAKGRAFYDSNGKPLRMMGTVQDITQSNWLSFSNISEIASL